MTAAPDFRGLADPHSLSFSNAPPGRRVRWDAGPRSTPLRRLVTGDAGRLIEALRWIDAPERDRVYFALLALWRDPGAGPDSRGWAKNGLQNASSPCARGQTRLQAGIGRELQRGEAPSGLPRPCRGARGRHPDRP